MYPLFAIKRIPVQNASDKNGTEYAFSITLPKDILATLNKTFADFHGRHINVTHRLIAYCPNRKEMELLPLDIIHLILPAKLVVKELITTNIHIKVSLKIDTCIPNR